MSALAQIMLHRGHSVTGSDRQQNALTKKLTSLGAEIYINQSAENIAKAAPDRIIYTAAIHEDNPELIAARASNLPVLERDVFLGELAAKYLRSVAVAGSHGKTSTTAMLTAILHLTGADPTALVGGELDLISGNCLVGNSDIFVTEACEYVDSFLELYPYIGLILNIDADHLDYFPDLESIISSFRTFADQIAPNGLLIYNGDDTLTARAITAYKGRKISCGFSPQCTYYLKNYQSHTGGAEADVYYMGEFLGRMSLHIPGKYNLTNALFALATAHELGIAFGDALDALAEFQGIHRRFEMRGKYFETPLIDDYAHHPHEISAALQNLREIYPNKKIHLIFQSHTYSRTKALLADFAESLSQADLLYLLPTYAAREEFDSAGSVEAIAAALSAGVPYMICQSYEDAAQVLRDTDLSRDDVIITMGAGPIVRVLDYLLRTDEN